MGAEQVWKLRAVATIHLRGVCHGWGSTRIDELEIKGRKAKLGNVEPPFAAFIKLYSACCSKLLTALLEIIR
jgi:hypothetical protein